MATRELPSQSTFSLIRILQLLNQGLRDAQPLPDWSDSEAVRDWFTRLMPTVRRIVAETVTTLDDATASLVGSIVTCDPLWEACWTASREILSVAGPAGEISEPSMAAIAAGCREADRGTGAVDPSAVATLVEIASDIAIVIRSVSCDTTLKGAYTPQPVAEDDL